MCEFCGIEEEWKMNCVLNLPSSNQQEEQEVEGQKQATFQLILDQIPSIHGVLSRFGFLLSHIFKNIEDY